MLPGGELLTDEISGTTSGDRIEATAWRGGVLVGDGLDVTAWSLDWDADRSVQGQATLTIADPDGQLFPLGMADPLGPGGSRIRLVWVSGTTGTRVPLDWWRIRSSDPAHQWRLMPGTDGLVRVAGGGSVTVRADELTCIPHDLDRLDAEGQPSTSATCLSEVRRLLTDIMAVTVEPGVTDRRVPASVVYDEGRWDAVDNLLTQVDAVSRMGGDGVLRVLPAALSAPVWTIDGGEDGALIDIRHPLSDQGVYNAVVSKGTTTDGAPLVGRSQLGTGPLAWGATSPFGRRPLYHQAIAQTAAGVRADARTRLKNLAASGEVDLPVVCLTHPGIQVHDTVTVVAATTAGDQPLIGRVVGKRMASAGPVPAKSMSLTVRVSTDALEAVARRVWDRA